MNTAPKRGVYLIDAVHPGTLCDRLQIAAICDTAADPCKMDWRGMIVTSPVQAEINSAPVVIVPTFMSDDSQPAGLVALKIVMVDGHPKFERFRQFPAPGGPEGKTAFRSHPSFPLLTHEGKNLAL